METRKKEENNERLGSNYLTMVAREFWGILGRNCKLWVRFMLWREAAKRKSGKLRSEGSDKGNDRERMRLEGWEKREMEGCVWRELSVWRKKKETMSKKIVFIFLEEACFFNVNFFFLKKITIDLENCEKFKTYVVSSHDEVNKKLNFFYLIVLYGLTLNLMSLKLNWNKRLNLKLMTM